MSAQTSEKKVVGRNVAIALGIICVILAVGLVGAIANYTSMISGKDNTIATKDSQISKLQTWLDGNETLLNRTQTWLEGNITYYQSAINWYNAQNLLNQINSLYDQIASLQSQNASLQSQINNLNQSYVELTKKYEDLLFHYNLLNGPASNFTTVQDLQITFTTSRTTYYYQDPVSGNATIKYLNGTAFEGSFGIIIACAAGSLSVGERFNLRNGFAEFSYGPPAFVYGPGTYHIKLGWIYTIDGFIVANPNTAGLPEVQVEAK